MKVRLITAVLALTVLVVTEGQGQSLPGGPKKIPCSFPTASQNTTPGSAIPSVAPGKYLVDYTNGVAMYNAVYLVQCAPESTANNIVPVGSNIVYSSSQLQVGWVRFTMILGNLASEYKYQLRIIGVTTAGANILGASQLFQVTPPGSFTAHQDTDGYWPPNGSQKISLGWTNFQVGDPYVIQLTKRSGSEMQYIDLPSTAGTMQTSAGQNVITIPGSVLHAAGVPEGEYDLAVWSSRKQTRLTFGSVSWALSNLRVSLVNDSVPANATANQIFTAATVVLDARLSALPVVVNNIEFNCADIGLPYIAVNVNDESDTFIWGSNLQAISQSTNFLVAMNGLNLVVPAGTIKTLTIQNISVLPGNGSVQWSIGANAVNATEQGGSAVSIYAPAQTSRLVTVNENSGGGARRPIPQPTMRISRDSGAEFTIVSILGLDGYQTCQIESSADLVNWHERKSLSLIPGQDQVTFLLGRSLQAYEFFRVRVTLE